MNVFRIGMVGLDTSHVPAFANLLHDTSHEHHVPGARIVAAFPGGSPDFEMSINRVPKYTEEMREKHQVEIVNSLSALRGKCDALMLESIDGRVHLAQFREVADWGVPVFIDKPLTVSTVEARELVRIAKEKKVRMTSASAMRFAASFQQALHADTAEPVIGGDFYGPMQWQEKCPGYFWYGIHTVEMLFAAMGTGCCEVHSFREELHDVVVGRWTDGRLGMVRGNRRSMDGWTIGYGPWQSRGKSWFRRGDPQEEQKFRLRYFHGHEAVLRKPAREDYSFFQRTSRGCPTGRNDRSDRLS